MSNPEEGMTYHDARFTLDYEPTRQDANLWQLIRAAQAEQPTSFVHYGCSSPNHSDPHACSCAGLEITWVAGEAFALMSTIPRPPQSRWDEFTARKQALLACIER